MRHRLELDEPNELELHVEYGWDPFAGFFGELRAEEEEEPIAEYSALVDDYDHAAPLLGLLHWLVLVGALSGAGLEEALTSMATPDSSRLSRTGCRALRVVWDLKRDAD